MKSITRIIAVTLVSAALVIIPMRSQAIVPVIAAWLLELTGGSILIGDLVAGQTGIISAILWWDCNKFALSAPCTSKTPIASTQQPKPAITVSLKPDTKRENPNPKKFNDPARGKRDVTPKEELPADGIGPPPVPSGPLSVGVYEQSPLSTQGGPTSDDTFQMTYDQSAARGGALVAGVIIVKQPGHPDRAFPFVAEAVTCVLPLTGDTREEVAACSNQQSQARAHVMAYGNSQRYYYERSGLSPKVDGVSRYTYMVIFYDQAKDVTINCDPGYALSGASIAGERRCVLTNAALVKKPTDTTCEVLFDADTKLFMTDRANPSCDGITDAAKLTLSSKDGSKTVEVGMNAGNGFDIGITKQDGSKTGLDTGVYDPGSGGYVIVHVNITPPPNSDSGMGCGGPGQGLCNVQEGGDNPTWIKSNDTSSTNRTADTGMKGKIDSISSGQFDWSFIPSIPTASCKNPSLKSPIGNVTVNMDICTWFGRLSFFINAVLSVFCIYGSVNQIQSAIRD
ncbi:hypothetical protein [Janthinobacterium sp. PAMC25594]|uniref:hypothetical protein n=1 Tax=Janthinobacterium sp. PAMC25594 TaxID=2861284 RepID=UPI001C62B1B1|nr:hypothetical protein [Janthinobacterium sp. PAMC25594]QYG06054.1 hypothetical protein KY494_22630 [Janthinobacterium sp. PAMC25594]